MSNEKIAFNFAIDVYEETNGKNFMDGLKKIIAKYKDKIVRSKSTNDMIAFSDNSGCKFEGHNMVMVDSIE